MVVAQLFFLDCTHDSRPELGSKHHIEEEKIIVKFIVPIHVKHIGSVM